MAKFTKIMVIITLTVTLGLGSLVTFGGVYDSYKQGLNTGKWHLLLNAFIERVGSDITVLSNLITNWGNTVDSLTLIEAVPTYSDASTFLLAGNYSALLTPGKRLVADCGADGLLPNTVVSCTYAAPNSTVVVTNANLTANLAAVSYYATRNGLNTYGSGDIVAAELGAPSWVNLQAAVALANASGRRLLLTPGNWPVTDNLNITAPCHPVPGALFVVATTKSLTISSLDAGLYQIFSLTGTGAVSLGAKVKECYPEWFGAVKDGATDDGVAITAACNALSATGCKRIVFSNGSYFIFEAGTAYTNLGTFTGFTGLQIVSDGATLAIDPANTFTAHYGAIFRLDGCHNVLVDGFNVSGPALTLTNIQDRESVEFVRAYHGCTNISMPHNRVQGVIGGLLVSRLVDGGTPSESAAYICKNINVGLLEVTNSSYGVACAHSGDNLNVGMIKADGVGRPYFIYGAKNHKVSITAKDCKLSGFSLSAYDGGGCEDIDVTYVDTESTNAFNYRSEIMWNDQTPAVFRNIRLHMNNVFGASGDTGTAVFRIGKYKVVATVTTDDTVDRGHILENLTVSGYTIGTPSTADAALYGTIPGAEWGADVSLGTDVWKNIKFKDLVIKNSTIPCNFAFGALDGDLTFENVDSPTLAWGIRKNFLVNFPTGRINVVGSSIKNLWKLTDTYYDAIMVVNLHDWATADAYTLDAKETGKLVSNENCANLQTVTLPPAVAGLRYTFNNLANGTNIDPDGTEVILGGGAGKYLSLVDAIGDHVTLVCQIDGYWQIESSHGTLAFEAP